MPWEREYKKDPGYEIVYLRPVTLTDRDLIDIGALLERCSDAVDDSVLSELKFEINGTHKSKDPDDLLSADAPVDTLVMSVTVEVLVFLSRRETAVHYNLDRPEAVECATRIIELLRPRQAHPTGFRPAAIRLVPAIICVGALAVVITSVLGKVVEDDTAQTAVGTLLTLPLAIVAGRWAGRYAVYRIDRHVLLARHQDGKKWIERHGTTIGIALGAAALIVAVIQTFLAI